MFITLTRKPRKFIFRNLEHLFVFYLKLPYYLLQGKSVLFEGFSFSVRASLNYFHLSGLYLYFILFDQLDITKKSNEPK